MLTLDDAAVLFNGCMQAPKRALLSGLQAGMVVVVVCDGDGNASRGFGKVCRQKRVSARHSPRCRSTAEARCSIHSSCKESVFCFSVAPLAMQDGEDPGAAWSPPELFGHGRSGGDRLPGARRKSTTCAALHVYKRSMDSSVHLRVFVGFRKSFHAQANAGIRGVSNHTSKAARVSGACHSLHPRNGRFTKE